MTEQQTQRLLNLLSTMARSSKEFTLTRATHTLFLFEWTEAFMHDRLYTGIDWSYEETGIDAKDLIAIISNSPAFRILPSQNRTDLIVLSLYAPDPLPSEEALILRHVESQTKGLNDIQLKALASTVYPILSTDFGSHIDLIEAAKRRKGVQHNQ
jgi:hypothetical protein